MDTPPAEPDPQLRDFGHSIGRNSAALLIIALCCAIILGGTELMTREAISEARQAVAVAALNEILPPHMYDNDLLQNQRIMTFDHRPSVIYTARYQGNAVAVIMSANAPDGYTGAIEFLVGLRRDGSIIGVRVTHHRETPGLGDKIELRKSHWILSFNGKSMFNPPAPQWRVKRDGGTFDQFTGATVTPRAMVHAIHNTLLYAHQHRDELFTDIAVPATTASDDGVGEP